MKDLSDLFHAVDIAAALTIIASMLVLFYFKDEIKNVRKHK